MTKMNKILSVGAVAFVLVLCSVVFSNARKPVRLVCDIWPPYQYEESNRVTGFSTEIVEGVYDSMGLTAESIKAYPWKRALSILESGHADALFSVNYTPDRMTFALYPKEVLFEAPWVIWSRGAGGFDSLEDLKGKRVGVVLGYSYTKEFWDFIETHCSVEKVSSDEINFKKLEFGRLDALIAEYGNGRHIVKKYGLHSVKPRLNIEIKRDGLYIMFNRDVVSESFVTEFSEKLAAYKMTAAYQELRRKYFGLEGSGNE